MVEVRKAKTQPGISQVIPFGLPSSCKVPAIQKESVVNWQDVTRKASHHRGFLVLRSSWRI